VREPRLTLSVAEHSTNEPPNSETVSELLSAVQGLVKDERDRETGFYSRASGLTGFVGLILALATAAGATTGRNAGAGLHHGVRVFAGILVALALLVLASAVVLVVWKVLLPRPALTIDTDEVERYPTNEFVYRDHVGIQGHLMNGFVISLKRERERNASKAVWLGWSYKLVCAGLVLVAFAGMAGTLDRYVA
jgi:hypothetical protein